MSSLARAYEYVTTASVSRGEARLATEIETTLRTASHLRVERIGDNVVAATRGTANRRVLLAGHLDTVPGDLGRVRWDREELTGLGAVDMKGSLAVMVELAIAPPPSGVELTWVFYAREEVSRSESGLLEIAALRPDLLQADVAVVGEPTGGAVEAGCQGSLRVRITTRGVAAHTARPYRGRNAIHRLGAVVERVARYAPRRVTLDGVAFAEQLQVVQIAGGIATNVVPDEASCVINHRFAPDRDIASASEWLREYVADVLDERDDLVVEDAAPAASPRLDDPRLAQLVELSSQPVRAKVGWTDVATLNELGIASTNFGAGDPELAHHRDERITRAELEAYADVLGRWLAAMGS
ncbi:MAG: succinyl-diaminopimelate desuccinylase [Acidimicrobiales bacterium]